MGEGTNVVLGSDEGDGGGVEEVGGGGGWERVSEEKGRRE